MDASRDAKGLGHGKGYQYPHSFDGHFTAQQYLPDALMGEHFYKPSDQGYEAEVADRLARWRAAQAAGLGILPEEEQGVQPHDDHPADPPRTE
jgi:putative ATPase